MHSAPPLSPHYGQIPFEYALFVHRFLQPPTIPKKVLAWLLSAGHNNRESTKL